MCVCVRPMFTFVLFKHDCHCHNSLKKSDKNKGPTFVFIDRFSSPH